MYNIYIVDEKENELCTVINADTPYPRVGDFIRLPYGGSSRVVVTEVELDFSDSRTGRPSVIKVIVRVKSAPLHNHGSPFMLG